MVRTHRYFRISTILSKRHKITKLIFSILPFNTPLLSSQILSLSNYLHHGIRRKPNGSLCDNSNLLLYVGGSDLLGLPPHGKNGARKNGVSWVLLLSFSLSSIEWIVATIESLCWESPKRPRRFRFIPSSPLTFILYINPFVLKSIKYFALSSHRSMARSVLFHFILSKTKMTNQRQAVSPLHRRPDFRPRHYHGNPLCQSL